MTWNTCLGGNDIIMFIMRLYKAKKIRKTIPNSFQMHKLLFSASSPSLAGCGVSHRQFFSEAELPPTISGDSGRARAGLGCHVEKHTVPESKSLGGKKKVSKCHHLLMGTRLQTKHPRKRTGTNGANVPLWEPGAAVSMGPLIDLPLDDSKHLRF